MSSLRTELNPGLQPETQETVGLIRVDHFALALRGLDISRDHGGMDGETYGAFRSRFSQLGNQALGPELFGVDSASEGSQ